MKREKIFDAITDIREETLRRAEGYTSTRRRRWWISAVAAVLVVAVTGTLLLRPGGVLNSTAYALAQAEYPTMAPYPMEQDYTINGRLDYEAYIEARNPWREDQKARRGPEGYDDGLDSFFAESISTFLSGAQGENLVYSPLNVYMALAMLAETTAGESREQILSLLGHEDIGTLREQAGYLWNANYRDDGATTSVLASSLWLNEYLDYHRSTVNTLAENYYASVYQGEMGSAGYDKALQDWLNEQTGGLLEEYAGQIEMRPETILALAATVYFKAQWDNKFVKENTREGVFHAADGDEVCDFMHSTSIGSYYWGDRFSAVGRYLENAGSMYFILPDEGYTVDDLLGDDQVKELMTNVTEYENNSSPIVNLSLPKFDVSSSIDLKEGLQKLGVTQVFDQKAADFTPLTPLAEEEDVWLEQATHAARVSVDEDGVEAAAYTVMLANAGATAPTDEIDFVLDRPFLFMLTGVDGQQPLFVGVVNHVE